MNFSNQLIRLIFDFYREDLRLLQRISSLQYCSLSRRWGTLQIRCPSQAIADDLSQQASVLIQPISALRLANQIKLKVARDAVAVLPVH